MGGSSYRVILEEHQPSAIAHVLSISISRALIASIMGPWAFCSRDPRIRECPAPRLGVSTHPGGAAARLVWASTHAVVARASFGPPLYPSPLHAYHPCKAPMKGAHLASLRGGSICKWSRNNQGGCRQV